MGQSVCFFAGPGDNQALCEYALSIGLKIQPPLVGEPAVSPTDDPSAGPFCYLTPVPESELHPYGNPPRVSDAIDPLLLFMRSYHQPPYLIMGHIHWSDDVPHLAKLTKRYFSKMAKWLEQNWRKHSAGEFIGPEAWRLVQLGAQLTDLPPGLNVETRTLS